jgi:hypothetical protein
LTPISDRRDVDPPTSLGWHLLPITLQRPVVSSLQLGLFGPPARWSGTSRDVDQFHLLTARPKMYGRTHALERSLPATSSEVSSPCAARASLPRRFGERSCPTHPTRRLHQIPRLPRRRHPHLSPRLRPLPRRLTKRVQASGAVSFAKKRCKRSHRLMRSAPCWWSRGGEDG